MDALTEIKNVIATISAFKLYSWVWISKESAGAKLHPTCSAIEFERNKKGWSFDFVNYLCVRLQKHRPKAYMIVFRNQNNHAEIKVTSCVVFYGKFVCVPELLKNGKATFKRFTTRNDIFNYILDNLPYFDTSYTFQNIYHYIPKNRSFSIYTLIGTIFNIGKRVIYPPKEELID